jgi:hypothetical protein
MALVVHRYSNLVKANTFRTSLTQDRWYDAPTLLHLSLLPYQLLCEASGQSGMLQEIDRCE